MASLKAETYSALGLSNNFGPDEAREKLRQSVDMSAFAVVMHAATQDYIRMTYKGKWKSPSNAVSSLKNWVENEYATLVIDVLSHVNPSEALLITSTDIEKWKDMAVNMLGRLRIDELFDIVVDWDNSKGAIEDLKQYVTTPTARSYLTSTFSAELSKRLLQPGASTIEILQVYISIIRAFNTLDPKGVLLDRIARPIRRYLRDRDDTVKVIVGGLLADVSSPSSPPSVTASEANSETLIELALELNRMTEASLQEDSDVEDWDDMNWVPDPIDAAPDYKKSKNADVIGSLISLYDSKEIFVKEFQANLGERLISKDTSVPFDNEIRVLELLKLRSGEQALQACEVMLKDVLDSRRVDTTITNTRLTPPGPDQIQFHSKILSRLYWPPLRDSTFRLPPSISPIQTHYSTAYEKLKPARKLTWLPALGTITVELDLTDRVVQETCSPWQASVISAFSDLPTPTTTLTTSHLEDTLEMEPELIHNALTFWIARRVLHEPTPSTYAVLETLPTDSAAADASRRASLAEDEINMQASSTQEKARMDLIWQFIKGMLTNQGAMPLMRITMMLKMVVPEAAGISDDELRGFLSGKVEENILEIGKGGAFKIAK
ncbi:MAG: hypothetical protein M1834_003697 [Cirrosporium novae-zelandiae]|nr:MAG: hypothetical protein M1834_003697 [Cirrosporium novae-zelandiae]